MISGPMPSPRMTVIVWVIVWGSMLGGRRARAQGVVERKTAPDYAGTAPALPADGTWTLRSTRLSVVYVLCRRLAAALEPVEEIHRAPQVRDHDAAAHHQPHREGFEHLVPGHPGPPALGDVVADAVVAAQHQRRDQAQQFLGLHVQRPGLVGLGVEREEAPHHLVGLGQDALVHALPERGESADAVALVAAAHASLPASSGSKSPARCRAIMSS